MAKNADILTNAFEHEWVASDLILRVDGKRVIAGKSQGSSFVFSLDGEALLEKLEEEGVPPKASSGGDPNAVIPPPNEAPKATKGKKAAVPELSLGD